MICSYAIILTGCATITNRSYNTPFINADETVQLNFGMTRDEVLNILNEPLFVAYGDNNEIIWVYEVRTIQVSSKMIAAGGAEPNKTSNRTKHAAPLHQLALTFSNGKLNQWGPYNAN